MREKREPLDMQSTLDQLRALAEAIRVRVDLAGMDAKYAWRELERRLTKVESELEQVGGRLARDLAGTARRLLATFRDFRNLLRG